MLFVNSLSVYFGATVLFDNVSFVINPKERVGLTGKNGAGKSTLLKIIAGWNKPTEGSIDLAKGTTVGYLPQDLEMNTTNTVLEETRTAFAEVITLNQLVEDLTHKIETTDHNLPEYMDLLVAQSDAIERLGILGSDTLEADIIKVLIGLGFKQTDLDRKVAELSGGWRMRIELAKILLRKPDIILLDEPTNHLDIESIQWLEEFLGNYPGVVMMVSHDKTFLDIVTNRTIEIANRKIYDYNCNYSQYVIERKYLMELQMATKKNQEKEIERTQALIDKFRAKANKASFAQSLIKRLDKMEVMDVDDDSIATMKFRFPSAPRSGLTVVEAENYSKSFGPKKILWNVNMKIERGQKVAFVGKNGMGKTTFGKTIVGEESFEGGLQIGTNVSMGYYAQHQAEKLEPEYTVLETIESAMRAGVDINARSLLGAFLFGGDDVYKKVKVLSGGEKSRLSLAKLMLEEHNLLLLDEPTNHLDMISISVLKEALSHFNGTMIVISHDRDFLAGLTEKVYEFIDGNVKEYLGDINYFLEQKKLSNIREFELEKSAAVKKNNANPYQSKDKKENSQTNENGKQNNRKLEQAELAISKLEKSISALEFRMTQVTDYTSAEWTKLQADYSQLKKELEVQMQLWETLI